MSKIVEKLLGERIVDFVNKHDILSNSQYGFRKSHSTNLALLNFYNNITSLLEENKFAISIFIDLKKAFDTINPSILISKLNRYGIRGVCQTLLVSYLNNRLQIVKIFYPSKPTAFSGSIFRPDHNPTSNGSVALTSATALALASIALTHRALVDPTRESSCAYQPTIRRRRGLGKGIPNQRDKPFANYP